MDKIAGSVEKFSSSSGSLAEYEATGIIDTLVKQTEEIKTRENIWRYMIGLPRKLFK